MCFCRVPSTRARQSWQTRYRNNERTIVNMFWRESHTHQARKRNLHIPPVVVERLGKKKHWPYYRRMNSSFGETEKNLISPLSHNVVTRRVFAELHWRDITSGAKRARKKCKRLRCDRRWLLLAGWVFAEVGRFCWSGLCPRSRYRCN